jgi:hypothetical protein
MWAIGLTAAAHTGVFANALRRYGVGISTEANWADMFGATKWEPPLGWLPLALAYLALTAVAGVLLYRQLSPGQPPAGEPIKDGSSLS